MPDLLEVTIPEMLKEAERELALRQRVYPRRIANKQMTRVQADRYLELQQAIVTHFARLLTSA